MNQAGSPDTTYLVRICQNQLCSHTPQCCTQYLAAINTAETMLAAS
jgi:hypothetical protein